MQSVAFITSTSQDRIKLISPTPINHTYLEQFLLLCTDDNLLEGSYSIHRQIWWTLMAKLGLRVFGSTSSISTWCKEFGQHEGKGKLNMLDDPRQYNVSDIGKHNPLSCLPCPTSTILAYNILMGAHNHKRCPRQCICM